MTGSDSTRGSQRSVLPQAIHFCIYKPLWRRHPVFCLTFLLIAFLTVCAGIVSGDYARAYGAFMGLSVIEGIVAVGMVIGFIIDYVGGLPSIRRMRSLRELSEKSAAQSLELKVCELALKGHRNIPRRCVEQVDSPLPTAIFLTTTKGRSIPTPTSSDVPFEPLPLGQDLYRTKALLEEFVGVDLGKNAALFRDRKQRERISPTWRTPLNWALLVPALAFCWWRLSPAGFSVVALIIVASLVIRHYGCDLPRLDCWLFPGVIAVRKRHWIRGGHRDLVFRRASGTLWYDARESKLFLPFPDGTYHALKCSPYNGLLAIWTWLNTADPPDHIHLDNIA